jgi:hypothetical protein
MLDAATFAPQAPDTVPFGIDSNSVAAIKALRDLADAMERGTAVVEQAQTGTTAVQNEFIGYRVFLEYKMRPWG